MAILDSRSVNKHRQFDNKRKFLKRHRKSLRESVRSVNKKIRDLDGDQEVKVRPDREYTIGHTNSRPKDLVLPGNTKYKKGDEIDVGGSGEGEGNGGAGDGGEGEDAFSFELSRDEFIDLYFEDLELPDFIKEQLKSEVQYKLVIGGFSKEGIPPRLSIKKTFESAIARRLANKKEGHKSPFLDDSDMRYIRKNKVPVPIKAAVMFCVMDVSASMEAHHKERAKKFYFLLYLFLTKFYKNIEIVFIRYHTDAAEVSEEAFFYGKDTGGTMVSKGFSLANDIIEERYSPDKYNLYLAHVSDGDLWSYGDETAFRGILDKILPKLQYLAYVNVADAGDRRDHVGQIYREIFHLYNNIGVTVAGSNAEIYPALRKLFIKKGYVA